MSDTPIKDALDKLGSGGDGFSLGGDLKSKTIGAEATFTPGKWTLSGAWQYTKDLGHSVLGKITWKP